MFEKVNDIPIPPGTIAPWPSNLAVCWLDTRNITFAAVIQGNNVNIGSWDNKNESPVQWDTIVIPDLTGEDAENKGCNDVMTVGLVHPNARNFPVLIVGSTQNIQVYDVRKGNNKCLLQVSLETALQGFESEADQLLGRYCRGVSCNDNTILIGTHCGAIVLVMCNGESSFTTRRALKEHNTSIADIATCRYDEITASGDANGEIIIWQKPMKAVQLNIKTEQNINVMNILRKQVIVGTMTGLIRFYAVTTGELMCELTSHARPVTAISVAPESAYVLTAAEDGTCMVSKLHTRKPHAYQVEFRFSDCDPNLQIVGAQFTNGRGSAIAIAGYDQNNLISYKIVKKASTAASSTSNV